MALTDSEIIRAEENVKAVNTWAEGGAGTTATMANGRQVPSPLKLIADAKLFKAPIAWSPGLNVTDATQSYTNNNVVYAPQPTLLPFVTPGAFLSTNWYVVQGVLESELPQEFNNVADMLVGDLIVGQSVEWYGYYTKYDSGGNHGIVVAALTGVDDGGSFFDLNNGLQVQALFNSSVVDVRKFGAADKSVLADSLAFIQNAANFSERITINDNLYVVSAPVSCNQNQEISGNGTIEFGGTRAIESLGVVNQEVDLTVAITANVDTISVVDGSQFFESEIVRIVSTINCLSIDAMPLRLGQATGSQISYFTEYMEILSISGNNVTFTKLTTFDNYPLIPGATTPLERQISVLQKLDSNTLKIDGLSFIRTSDSGHCMYIELNVNSKISNCYVNNKTYEGASIYMFNSYRCFGGGNTSSLDSNVVMTAGDFFRFNSFMLVGSNNCTYDSNQVFNGSQCFDVSYIDAPSLNCIISSNVAVAAKINIATTHNGGYQTTMINNQGTTVGSGISLKCRNDRCIGNYINGSVSNDTSLTGADTYGISSQDGYTQGLIVRDNVVIDFYRGFILTDNNNIFAAKNFTIMNNDFSNARTAIELFKSSLVGIVITDEMSGIVISGNTFRNITFEGCVLVTSGYINGVEISHNSFLSNTYAAGAYCIDTEENQIGHIIKNNVFPENGRSVRVRDIVDTVTLGPNTIENLRCFASDNTRLKGLAMEWYFNFDRIGNFGPLSSVNASDIIDVINGQTEIDISSTNLALSQNSSGVDVTLDTINGGYSGQIVYFSASSESAGSSTYLASGGNIDFDGTPTPIQVKTDSALMLIKRGSGNYIFIRNP